MFALPRVIFGIGGASSHRLTAFVAGPAARADLNYRAEITGAEDSNLASLLDKVSELKTLEEKPPASEEAL